MTVSASWDTDLMARWSKEMAVEFGARGQLGPGINLARFAWNGRLGEYMAGEDPYFGARMVAAMVTAYRTVPNPPLQVAKHFIPNTIENDRAGMTEVVDERTLFEVYYPPFAAAVEAGVSAIMCSYNAVKCTSGLCEGTAAYACANDDVLNKHLKDIMGFKGIVMSDWDATKCQAEAAGTQGCSAGAYVDNAVAAQAGLDLEMPSCQTFKGGVTQRAKEKAVRTQWAYMVQGRSFSAGRRQAKVRGNGTGHGRRVCGVRAAPDGV
jgi:beta-glucosidase